MAQEMLQKQWFQSPEKFSYVDGPPRLSTSCQASQSLQTTVSTTVGDFVHIHPSDGQLRLYIARVEGVYQDIDGKKYMNVRWYYRPEDLQHQPPSCPKGNEVYHTDHLDCQLVDSIEEHCQVIFKTDLLKVAADERSIANEDKTTYICEFAYSTQTGIFSSLSSRDTLQSETLSSAKLQGTPGTVASSIEAKELIEDPKHYFEVYVPCNGSGSGSGSLSASKMIWPRSVLLNVEASIPKEILPTSWGHLQQAWCQKTTNSTTVKEVAQALLDLEDGVQIVTDLSRQCPKDDAARRKAISGIHSYDLLAKYVKLFKVDVQHTILEAVSNINQAVRGIRHDHGLEKRKYAPQTSPQTKPPKLQRLHGIHSSFFQKAWTNAGQSVTRPVHVEVLPQSSYNEFAAENVYTVDQEFLPLDAPTSLKFMRAVLVAEKTRFNVTVTFPSMTSLQSYFGRTPVVKAEERIAGISQLPRVKDHMKKETCMGTKPELDGHYNLTPKVAERFLIRPVSCTEYLHRGHLWCFWIVEDPEEERISESICGDKEISTDHDPLDETKGALSAAEALTQLIPRDALINSPEENGAGNEGCIEYGNEAPLVRAAQIRWGMRSLRKASFGNRSGNGISPNSCDARTKEARNKGRGKKIGRKILDFSDTRHCNIGRTRIIHDFMPTERSSRMHSRAEEKVHNAGAVKCKDTSDKSKQVRSNIILKLPKDMKGRWASERYKSAQLKLIDIMHERRAIPGNPILRPALREEARKDIGDTGLLDHLLKHMTDTVITNGERFRRRHNSEGAMEYWLEDANLMEIRKAAGIEDPSWIPPPGWNPGDALPGKGEYGYGCFNRGMTSAELAEMKKLKDTVNKVRSDLQTLFSRVKRSRSRELPTEHNNFQKDQQESITENMEVIANCDGDLKAVEVEVMEFKPVHGELGRKEQSKLQQQQSITNTRFRDRRSTGQILTVETKSQLETDLLDLQESVTLMQGYVDNTMTELGFLHGEDINIASKHVKSGDLKSKPVSDHHDLIFGATTLAPPTVERNCSALGTFLSPATSNVQSIPSDHTDKSERNEADFVTSVDDNSTPLSQPNIGVNTVMKKLFMWNNTADCGYFIRPGNIINQSGAFRGWAEDVLVPACLPPTVNTSSCLGLNTETSCEAASGRDTHSLAVTDDNLQYSAYVQHQDNFFLPSTDSRVTGNTQSTLYPDAIAREDRVSGTAADERDFQPPGYRRAPHQSELQALAAVRREGGAQAAAGDGLTILSFAAGCEAVDKGSQELGTDVDIQGVLQNRVSAVSNLKRLSSSAPGASTQGYSASDTVYPEARKRRMQYPVEANHLAMSSITSFGLAGGILSRNSLSAIPAAECDIRGSFQPSAPVANRLFDETLASPTTCSSPRGEHAMVTSELNETPTVHMAKDLSVNLSLTSQVSSGHRDSGSRCSSSTSVSRSLAEPSTTFALSAGLAAQEGGTSGHAFPPRHANYTDQVECSQRVAWHGMDELQAIRERSLLKVRSSMRIADIVMEKYSNQNSTRGSTWLGLAPPTSDNLHS